MKVSLSQIKSWFKKGMYPTESQFANTFDSFWHKDDTLPLSAIQNLMQILNDKASVQLVSGKQDKTDTTLQTADKTVVGAINEVNTKTSNIEREIGNEDLLSDHAQSIKGAIAEINTWRGNASQDIEHLVGDMPFKQDKTDTTLQTADKTVVGAINEVNTKTSNIEREVGDMPFKQDKTDTTLQTADKTVVGAINEVNTKTSNIEREIGNEDLLSDHAQSIKGAIAEINTWRGNASQDIEHLVGDMPFKQDKTDTTLQTADKTVVGAINEIWGKVKELWNRMTDYLKGIYHVTYTELRELRTNSELVPGRWYRITDYMTTVANDPEARSAGHPFDVLVMATDVDTLSEEARAVKSSRKDIIPARFYSPSMDAWFERDEMNDGIYNGEQLYAWKSGEEYAFTKKHIPENNDDVFVAFDIEGNGWGTLSSIYTLENFNEIGEDLGEVINSKDYFADANLNAWKVWYSIDNDTTRFQWADTENGKGVIWRMIDEWQNDCPYDFKNVQFKRYKVTPTTPVPEDVEEQQLLADLDGTYIGTNAEMQGLTVEDYDDFVWVYTFSFGDRLSTPVDASLMGYVNDEQGEGYGYKGYYGDNVILPCTCHQTIDDEQQSVFCLNNVVWFTNNVRYRSLICGNRIDSECINMTLSGHGTHIKHDCQNIIMGDGCLGNTFGVGCFLCTFGNYCGGNTFGNYCYRNTFGNDCWHNTFGNDCYENTFGNNSGGNTFGNSCSGNTFGNYFQYNTFGNGCCDNTFGNYFQYNTFGNGCWNNTFGNGCCDNTFGNGCNWNTFGNNCHYITVHNSVQYVDVPGSSTVSAYVQNAQILNGTHGADSSNLLQISFQEDADYCQYAGLNSSGNLRIWTPADAT